MPILYIGRKTDLFQAVKNVPLEGMSREEVLSAIYPHIEKTRKNAYQSGMQQARFEARMNEMKTTDKDEAEGLLN